MSLKTFSQEFAPIGSKWYVEILEPFSPDWFSTLTHESLRDTTIQNKPCRILNKSFGTIFNLIMGEYIIHQKGDSIFHYVEEMDSFNLIMNFAAEPGEYWDAFDLSNSNLDFGFNFDYRFYVDEITETISLQNDTLKTQIITLLRKEKSEDESQYYELFQMNLIEKIGFKSAMLPIHGGDGFSDDQYERFVLCYQNPDGTLINFADNCIISSSENLNQNESLIYPNPAYDFIYFNGQGLNENSKIQIFNSNGVVQNVSYTNNKINISNLNSGFYLIRVHENQSYKNFKFIKY